MLGLENFKKVDDCGHISVNKLKLAWSDNSPNYSLSLKKQNKLPDDSKFAIFDINNSYLTIFIYDVK